MKVILSKDISKVGIEGEIVTVADGFARNYLLPRGLAVEAVGGVLKEYEQHQAAQERKAGKLLAQAQTAQAALDGRAVTIAAKSGVGERLYGSITAADIAGAIQSELGVAVDKRKIGLLDPIKAVGTYSVPVKLHRDIAVTVTINVAKA
jgi:large subunit ribosomal protein L9